jgi:NADH-quinone oxidoreductase subunit I
MVLKESDIIRVDEPELSFWEKLYFPGILKGLWLTLRHIFRKKRCMQYPRQRREQMDVSAGGLRNSNYRGLHRLNKDEQDRVACVACFMCETACPANCITIVGAEAPWPDREKYPVVFEIDELRCIYCGMCEYACPVDAIELTPVYNHFGTSRAEMIYDKEKLLEMYDKTKDVKPRKKPVIVGYHCQMKEQADQYWNKVKEKENKL